MIKELRDSEICLYIHEYIFVYDLYKSNNKNYEITLNDIILIINDNNNKDYFHKILLEIVEIDNYKDEMLNIINNNNKIKISLDSDKYSKKLINVYKEFINNSISYKILNDILSKSLIILIKSGKTHKHLIKFNETQISSNELKRISETDYTNENCLICLENVNDFKSFRIFNCCFSKTCCLCYKANNYKCPICNIKNDTLISY
jgi:hypothetical protein